MELHPVEAVGRGLGVERNFLVRVAGRNHDVYVGLQAVLFLALPPLVRAPVLALLVDSSCPNQMLLAQIRPVFQVEVFGVKAHHVVRVLLQRLRIIANEQQFIGARAQH